MRKSRKSLVIPLVALLFAGGTTAASLTGPSPTEALRQSQNAQRFLELTGSDTGASEAAVDDDDGGRRDERDFEEGEEEDDEEAGSASLISADRTPQGWTISPAGRQVPVLRFPIGITATPDGENVIVSSDNGGLQGLTLIDTDTLASVPTPASNLFMGVVARPDGKVYASGGNANRVFRFKQAAVAAVNADPTNALFPVHSQLDENFGDALPLPVGDGIRVNGYPGNAVLSGDLMYIAGTLSEATGTGGDACPSGQPACARVDDPRHQHRDGDRAGPGRTRCLRHRHRPGTQALVRVELGRRGRAGQGRRRDGVGDRHRQSARDEGDWLRRRRAPSIGRSAQCTIAHACSSPTRTTTASRSSTSSGASAKVVDDSDGQPHRRGASRRAPGRLRPLA